MVSRRNVNDKNQQMMLIRDEISETLMIVDAKKLSCINEMSKVVDEDREDENEPPSLHIVDEEESESSLLHIMDAQETGESNKTSIKTTDTSNLCGIFLLLCLEISQYFKFSVKKFMM
jgi:hypothetical protein